MISIYLQTKEGEYKKEEYLDELDFLKKATSSSNHDELVMFVQKGELLLYSFLTGKKELKPRLLYDLFRRTVAFEKGERLKHD